MSTKNQGGAQRSTLDEAIIPSYVKTSASMLENFISLTTKKPHEINIKPLDAGYVVKVGCKEFAIATRAELIKKLDEYLAQPDKIEEKFNNGNYFKK